MARSTSRKSNQPNTAWESSASRADSIYTFTANYRDQASGESYDANGNTTVSETKGSSGSPTSANDIYSFDNRLIRRTRGDGLVVDVLYNTDGDRVAKWVKQGSLNLSIHRYLVDRTNPTGYSQVVEEKDGSGELVSCHLYGHDLIAFDDWITRANGLPQRLTTPERRWYQYDGLGSVRGLSNDDGVLVEEYTYEAYGTLIGFRQLDPATSQLVTQNPDSLANLTSNRYLFTGEQWDPDLGMYFLRARYLNTNTGRFHTEDTYEGSQTEPATLHKYSYAHSNPVSNVDPSGNFVPLWLVGIFVHQKISAHFVAGDPANRVANRQIRTIVSYFLGTSPIGSKGVLPKGDILIKLPDLVDYATQEVYEIKPAHLIGQGAVQMATYVGALNLFAGPGWKFGTSYVPPGSVDVGFGFKAFIVPASVAGMVLYELYNISLATVSAATATTVITIRFCSSMYQAGLAAEAELVTANGSQGFAL